MPGLVSAEMANHLWRAYHFSTLSTIQANSASCPQWDWKNALRLRVKGRYVSFHLWINV